LDCAEAAASLNTVGVTGTGPPDFVGAAAALLPKVNASDVLTA
jgi:hypothetical protein